MAVVEEKTGFVVVRLPGGNGGYNNQPTVIHDTIDIARAEAERLCRKTGLTFTVFRSVVTVAPASAPLEWIEGLPSSSLDDIPF